MTDQLRLDGVDVAPGVLQTIVSLAATGVDGVRCMDGGSGLKNIVQKSGKGVDVSVGDDGSLSATVHLQLAYGRPLQEVALDVRRAVADALVSQTGQPVASVDVYVDSVVFDS